MVIDAKCHHELSVKSRKQLKLKLIVCPSRMRSKLRTTLAPPGVSAEDAASRSASALVGALRALKRP